LKTKINLHYIQRFGSYRTENILCRKASQLMLCEETVGVYYEVHADVISMMYGKIWVVIFVTSGL
jgi:hypothetical protein